MSEEDYKDLQEKVKELRMALLFEEPCPLYDPLYEEFEDGVD